MFLKQSTQIVVKIGPFLDKTDGVTEETGLASNATEISKSPGAAFGAGPTLGTHDAEGWYPITLTTSHTDTVGRLVVKSHDSATHLPVWHEFYVLEEAIYDSLFGASAAGFDSNQRVDVGSWLGTAVTTSSTTAKPQVDVDSIDDDATAADNAELFFDNTGFNASNSTVGTVTTNTDMRGTDNAVKIFSTGTAQAGTATTIRLAASESYADDELIGSRVEILSGTGAGQSRLILDYAAATDAATVHSWTTNPDATSVYQIVGASADVQGWNLEGPADLTNSSFVNTDVHMWAGTVSTTAAGTLPDINVAQISQDSTAADNLEADYDGTGYAKTLSTIGFIGDNGITSSTIEAGAIGASELAADAVAEIADAVWDELQSGHTTGGTFGEIATEIASILVDTAEIGAAGAGLTEAGGTGDQLTALAPSSLLTTALTEGYATDGSTATAAQLLYMIWSVVAEFGISGTTLTARKLDGSTAAMTFTLNDGTNPTDRTRAT